jgi:hypothetical protein
MTKATLQNYGLKKYDLKHQRCEIKATCVLPRIVINLFYVATYLSTIYFFEMPIYRKVYKITSNKWHAARHKIILRVASDRFTSYYSYVRRFELDMSKG